MAVDLKTIKPVSVPMNSRQRFLSRVELKLQRLLEQEPDPRAAIRQAVRRLEAADLLDRQVPPEATPRQAALMMIWSNPAMEDLRQWISPIWEDMETTAELVTALLPKNESLD